jgi:hypothetical protein
VLCAAPLQADDDLDSAPVALPGVNVAIVADGIPLRIRLVAERIAERGLAGVGPGQIVGVQFDDALFNQSVFGPRLTAAGVRAALNARLAQHIAATDFACGLTAAQKQKLELAGRGDIAHFFWRVEEFRLKPQKFQVREEHTAQDEMCEWASAAAREIQRLRRDYQFGIFDDGSLFGRIRATSLTATQGPRYELVRDIEHLGGKIGPRPRERGAGTLTEVRLSATRIDDAGLIRLSQVKTLGSLLLDDTTITDAGLAHLNDMQDLEILDLRKTPITDAGLEALSGLVNLTSLRLDGTKITDAGLVHLQALNRLEYLHLGGTSITGAGFVHLQGLKNLQDLYMGETRFSDAALAHLRSLTALEHLSLSDTRITAAGLRNLVPLTRLKRLFLIGTEIPAASAAELNRSLPALTIIR